MASNRNKTIRRSAISFDISENALDYAMNQSMQNILNSEASTAYKKPWHRLERGLRLNRLRAFVDELGATRSFTPAEEDSLIALLTKALDKKLLNSKAAVEYDPVQEKITEIKPLVMHQGANGGVLFQLLEKRNAVTFRKRNPAASGPSGPSGPPGPPGPIST